jgi:hypothetical protein
VSLQEQPDEGELFYRARMMVLDHRPVSEAARLLCRDIGAQLERASTRRYKRGAARQRKFEQAIGAVIADLLLAAKRYPDRWSYRLMRAESFKECYVAYRTARPLLKGLTALGFVTRRNASYTRATEMFPGAGFATRYRAMPTLLELCLCYRISPGNVDQHFEPQLPRYPLELRAPARKVRGAKSRGRKIAYEASSTSRRLEDEVREINEFLRHVEIEGGIHRGYRRIFNQGTPSGYGWNKGGRLDSLGEGSYQTLKKAERARMRLNGEPVAEVDMRASYLTILHRLHGCTLDPARDPYAVEGLPREVVKAWVTMTLGHSRFHTRWTSDNVSRFAQQGIVLGKQYPIKYVQNRVLESLPILADWPEQGIDCFDLMYLESEIIVQAMLELIRNHSAPVLSVHDSLIVIQSRKSIAASLVKNIKKLE